MTALRNWLVANDKAKSTAADIQTALSETVEVSRNSERWYLTGIGKLIGSTTLMQLLGGLEAVPQLKPMLYVLQAGIFLDDEETRASIAVVRDAGLLTTDAATKLLDTGITYGPAWQKAGLTELPSVEAIEAARASIATEDLREQVAQRYQEVRVAIDAGDVLTWDAARKAMGVE